MASRPSVANINVHICVQYMINYLRRTPEQPNISNPLSRGSLSVFTGTPSTNIFQLALRNCYNTSPVVNTAVNAIKNEIDGREAWTAWALAQPAQPPTQYTVRHTDAERNQLIASLEQLLTIPLPAAPAPAAAAPPPQAAAAAAAVPVNILSQRIRNITGMNQHLTQRLLGVHDLATLQADWQYTDTLNNTQRAAITNAWNSPFYQLMRLPDRATLDTNPVYLSQSGFVQQQIDTHWRDFGRRTIHGLPMPANTNRFGNIMAQAQAPNLQAQAPAPLAQNLHAAFDAVADDSDIDILLSIPTHTELLANELFNRQERVMQEFILGEWYDYHNVSNPQRKSLSATYSADHSKTSRSLFSSNTLKTPSTNASESTKTIHELCNTKFKEIDTKRPFYSKTKVGRPIKGLIHKYRKICQTFVNPGGCVKKNSGRVVTKLKIHYLTNRRMTHGQTISVRDVVIGTELMRLFQLYLIDETILRTTLDSFFIKYLNQPGIDAGGLQRQFATNVAEQLFSYGNPIAVKKPSRASRSSSPYDRKPQEGIFVEIEAKNNIYTFNQNLNPALFTVNRTVPSKTDILRFAGSVYAWLMTNSIKCQHRLSKAILLNLLYKDKPNSPDSEIKDDDYGIIYLLESPASSKSFIDIITLVDTDLQSQYDSFPPDTREASMKLPTIEDLLYVEYVFNEPSKILKPLIGPNRDGNPPVRADYGDDHTYERALEIYNKENVVTFENYRTYINLTGKHKLLGPDMSSIDAFESGFYISRRYMKNRDFNIPLLDYLTFGLDITKETMDIIVSQVERSAEHNGDEVKLRILGWFVNILRSQPHLIAQFSALISAAVESAKDIVSPLELQMNTPKNYKDFLTKLLKFWTGSSSYYSDPQQPYRISFIDTSQRINAHTCFFTLDIPIKLRQTDTDYFITSDVHLLSQLILCVIVAGDSFSDA